MDKSWMHPTVPRCSREYILGCKDFLKFAWENRPREFGDEIYCPCVQCINKVLKPMNVVEDHILDRGFLRTYVNWTMHGEVEEMNPPNVESNYIDDMHTMLHDAFRFHHMPSQPDPNEPGPSEPGPSEPNKEAQKFYNLLKDADTPLYLGCKKSKLSFLVRMLHLKCLYQWSNKSFDMMLEVLKDTFEENINMPKNYYEAKKQLRDLGMDYIKIDVCPNDCMLYWKDRKRDEDKNECDICGTSRWTTSSPDYIDEGTSSSTKPKKKAAKVLRYFPITPRLQRLYMCSKTAEDMRWHDIGRNKDGALRHLADSKAWKCLNNKYPSFGSEIRNIRLGLASDGFNPFSSLSTYHSTWPVVLIPYNLPPWMCMKQPYFIMSLLIPGPSSPGNNIDVYLRPLVEELKELWAEGVETYDAHSKQNFQMHAALLWTINDFPALANLSGWSTKGNLACPSCHKDTCSARLVNGGKSCYMGSRRFTPLDHAFRKNKRSFDNKTEMREAPQPLSGHEILERLNGYDQITFGKAEFDKCGRKRKKPELPYNWKKISIFF